MYTSIQNETGLRIFEKKKKKKLWETKKITRVERQAIFAKKKFLKNFLLCIFF